MKKVRKIYQAIAYIELDTYVEVDGEQRLVQFRGGTLDPKVNGRYVTDDPKMIKALDEDSSCGVDYRCIDEKEFDDSSTVGAAGDPEGKASEAEKAKAEAAKAIAEAEKAKAEAEAAKAEAEKAKAEAEKVKANAEKDTEKATGSEKGAGKSSQPPEKQGASSEDKPVQTPKQPTGPVEVPEVTDIQAARDYLVENFEDMTAQKLPNGKSVLNAIEKVKDEVVFPNLVTE